MITKIFIKIQSDIEKNSEWLQASRNSEKPENDTKLKILKISRNCHKPSLPQGLEQFIKLHHVTKSVTFSFTLFHFTTAYLINTVHLRRDGVSPSVFYTVHLRRDSLYQYLLYCYTISKK